MTLKIQPVMLGRSIYLRVPNDIADLIGVNPDANFTMKLVEHEEEFLLIYSVTKDPRDVNGANMALNEFAPLTRVSDRTRSISKP